MGEQGLERCERASQQVAERTEPADSVASVVQSRWVTLMATANIAAAVQNHRMGFRCEETYLVVQFWRSYLAPRRCRRGRMKWAFEGFSNVLIASRGVWPPRQRAPGH